MLTLCAYAKDSFHIASKLINNADLQKTIHNQSLLSPLNRLMRTLKLLKTTTTPVDPLTSSWELIITHRVPFAYQ